MEGQCGVETSAIATRPTPILELLGCTVASLSAGKLNSGVVVGGPGRPDGEAWTWGCGKAGKLGHGSGDAMHEPCRVRHVV